MGITLTLTRSCRDCVHTDVCKMKPEPDKKRSSSSAHGILVDIPWGAFNSKVFAVYGSHCKDYQKGGD